MNLHFTPFPVLQTPRLELRALRTEDAPQILVLRSDPVVLRHIPITPAKNLQDAQDYIAMINSGVADDEWIMWAICKKESEELIGTLCFWNIAKDKNSGEIGYVLLPQYHRQGIMSEAVGRALAYGFETIDFETIDAVLTPKNINSVGLLQKFDFQLDPQFEEEGEVRYYLSKAIEK